MSSQYEAYMLRLWQVGDSQDSPWRASLENAHTGERRIFGSRRELFAFLEELMPDQPSSDCETLQVQPTHDD